MNPPIKANNKYKYKYKNKNKNKKNIIDCNNNNNFDSNTKLKRSKAFINIENNLNYQFSIYNVKHKKIILNNKSHTKIKSVNVNYNDYEINSLSYKEALKIDKRKYIQYYCSLLKMKHIIIFTFFNNTDYNSKIIKINLFLFSFSLYYTVNALFFTDSTIHKIYKDKGLYNFIYQIPSIIYSLIISSIINFLFKFFSMSERDILKVKNAKINREDNLKKIINILILKFILFYILDLLFLILFWYYLACFCAVYKNTQICLIKDTLISFSLSLLYPFGFNLLPGIFRIPSLNGNKRNRECLYKTSKIIQLII